MKTMKLLISLVAIILTSCASAKVAQEPIYCDQEDLMVPTQIYKSASGNGTPVALPDSVLQRWQKTKKILEDDFYLFAEQDAKQKNYFRIYGGCDQPLVLAKVDYDEQNNIKDLQVGVKIKDNHPENFDEADYQQKDGPVMGIGDENNAFRPVRYAVKAYYTNDTSHAKYKYDWKQVEISWILDPRDKAIAIVQYSNDGNEKIYKIEPGKDFFFLNKEKGNKFQIIIQKDDGTQDYFNVQQKDNGRDDIIDLVNVRIVNHYASKADEPEFLFLILPPVASSNELSNNQKYGQIIEIRRPRTIISKSWLAGQEYIGKKRKKKYSLRQKYPEGWFWLETKFVYEQDRDFYTFLANYKKIVKGQKYVVVGANYLQKWSPRLYKMYKNKNRFSLHPVTRGEDSSSVSGGSNLRDPDKSIPLY